jgi:hypothetical protein
MICVGREDMLSPLCFHFMYSLEERIKYDFIEPILYSFLIFFASYNNLLDSDTNISHIQTINYK